jgi:hypothetical protein
LNSTQSDLTFTYTLGNVTHNNILLGGFEITTICAETGSVSAESGISITVAGSC